MIWSPQYRWDFLCQHGSKAATDKLAQMLKLIGPLAVPATRVPASDQPGSQTAQETQHLMTEARSLVTAMYSTFKGELNHFSIPGFQSFEDVALALDLHWVYSNLVEAKLRVSCLLQCM